MKRIQSPQNQYIKAAKQLKNKKYRDKTGLFLVEGIRLMEEAMNFDHPLEYCLVADGGSLLLAERLASKCPVFSVSPELLSAVAETENPQGIIAVARQKETGLEDLDGGNNGFLMIVDGVQDPGNLGTIIRTSAAAGVDGMVLTETTVDLYNGKTVRASMGSMFQIPIVAGKTPSEVSGWLIANGYKIIVGHVGAEKLYFDVDYKGKTAIVAGNENHGPSEIFKDKGVPVRIPCLTESLNVSVASALLLYERVRQVTGTVES